MMDIADNGLPADAAVNMLDRDILPAGAIPLQGFDLRREGAGDT